jgi:hypothetical protein
MSGAFYFTCRSRTFALQQHMSYCCASMSHGRCRPEVCPPSGGGPQKVHEQFVIQLFARQDAVYEPPARRIRRSYKELVPKRKCLIGFQSEGNFVDELFQLIPFGPWLPELFELSAPTQQFTLGTRSRWHWKST